MSQTLYEKALIFATRKHSGQARKVFPVPYICHPVHVSSILYDLGCRDENILAAALLHDTLEDTQTTYEELVKEFNPVVADLVQELTNTAEAKQDKVAYTKKRFNEMTPQACLIKSADMLSNFKDIVLSKDKLPQEEFRTALNIIAQRVCHAKSKIGDLLDCIKDDDLRKLLRAMRCLLGNQLNDSMNLSIH